MRIGLNMKKENNLYKIYEEVSKRGLDVSKATPKKLKYKKSKVAEYLSKI